MFALTESLLTGVAVLDGEHEALVASLNCLAEAERRGDRAEAIRELRRFHAELVRHFEGEERHLERIGFPGRLAHVEHHAEVAATIDRVIGELASGSRDPGGIATECYGKLLRAVLLMDMQVVNWQADRVLA